MVRDGQTTNGDRKLVPIDPGPATLQGKISPGELEEFPIDGRDVLNTQQFQPGIVIQDGRSLDPTKTGNLGVSIDKVSGLSFRKRMAAYDISDETRGDV